MPHGLQAGLWAHRFFPGCFSGIPDRAHQSCLLSALHALASLPWLTHKVLCAGSTQPDFTLGMQVMAGSGHGDSRGAGQDEDLLEGSSKGQNKPEAMKKKEGKATGVGGSGGGEEIMGK